MLRTLAPLAAVALIASPALAATQAKTVTTKTMAPTKHHAKVMKTRTTTTAKKTS